MAEKKTKMAEMENNKFDNASYTSPIGRMILHADKSGLTKIECANDQMTRNETEGATDCINTCDIDCLETALACSDNIHLHTSLRWLDQYFKDPTKLGQVEQPVLNMSSYSSKGFLVKVWQVLRKVSKVGESITYGQVAALAGNSKASQSVGQAMRRNPFVLIVPCHRVIRANAKIGNYSWLNGVVTKKWLLDHEKKFIINHKKENSVDD